LNDLDFQIGRVVYSKKGRDAGRYFIVVAEDEGYAIICDGQIRKLANPKKKKLKHLEPKPFVLDAIREKLLAHNKVFDSEIRNALESLGLNTRS